MTASLHKDTLRVAHALLTMSADDAFALRRAVSSAYFALFQGLCAVVAKSLSRANAASDEYRRAFRLLDHRLCRNHLNASFEFKTDLGVPFAELQDIRQWADYSAAPHPDDRIARSGGIFSPAEAHRYCRKADISLAYLGGLQPDEQIRLLVTLVVRERP